MDTTAVMLVSSQDGAASGGTGGGKATPGEARAVTLIGVFGLAIGAVVLLIAAWVVVIVLKRNRRLAELKADTARRRAMDPWSEAGRRASTPEAEDLEPE